MSQYTTELRFLLKNFSDEKIFGNYPIFDENYRESLNTKIKEFYFFDEIGIDPPAKFCQRMRSKMLMIMPYYNQLYESELKVIEPFITKRYGYTLQGLVDKVAESKDDTARTVQDILTSLTEGKNDGSNVTTTDNIVASNSSESHDSSEVVIKNSDNTQKHNVTRDRGEEEYDNYKDVFSYQNEKDIKNYNLTDKTTYNSSNTNVESGNISHTNQKMTKEVKSVTSDAPEGLVQLSNLENNLYANTATISKEVDSPSGSSKDTFNNHTNATTKSGNDSVTKSGDESSEKSGGHTNQKTGKIIRNGSKSEEILNDTNELNESVNKGSSSGTDMTVNTTIVDNSDGSKNSESTNKTDFINDIVNAIKKDIATELSNNEYSTQGFDGRTMSSMLSEWRETFLNIDAMVIKDLSDMFMQILL